MTVNGRAIRFTGEVKRGRRGNNHYSFVWADCNLEHLTDWAKGGDLDERYMTDAEIDEALAAVKAAAKKN